MRLDHLLSKERISTGCFTVELSKNLIGCYQDLMVRVVSVSALERKNKFFFLRRDRVAYAKTKTAL